MRHLEITALFALSVAAAACSVPYPVVVSAGGFEVHPSVTAPTLTAAGGRVQVVSFVPPGCAFLGLATGVGGAADQYERGGAEYLRTWQDQAVVALRNAVGEAGGTHTIVDAEVQWTSNNLRNVLVRGPALRCP
jgi:hypothetical protein